MRVIGVDISAAGLVWVLLDGTSTSCAVEDLTPAKLSVPQAERTQVDNLLALKANIIAVLAPIRADFVGVIKATKDCSVERVKIECMLQIAAKERSVECVLVPPQSVSWAEKRHLVETADAETQKRVAGINPKYLMKAAFAAWCVLNGRR